MTESQKDLSYYIPQHRQKCRPFTTIKEARIAITEEGLSYTETTKYLKAFKISGFNRAKKDVKEYILGCMMVQSGLLLSAIEELG